jgi:hypothetical protein
MRCPNCKKILPLGAGKSEASIRCLFCGAIFRAAKEPEKSPKPAFVDSSVFTSSRPAREEDRVMRPLASPLQARPGLPC